MSLPPLSRWLCALTLLAMSAEAPAATLKIATIAPEGTSWMKELRTGATEIEKRTAGRVKLKFFPGGVMGNDKSVLRKIRAGQLQGGALASTGLTDLYKDAQLYSLPMLFHSYEEVDYVRARMDQTLQAGLEEAGLVPLGISEGGFTYLMAQSSISEVEELKGKKVWVPEGDPVSQAALEYAGVTPVPLPFADVYTALQTGLLDTVFSVPTGAIAFQWYTKLKSLVDMPVTYVLGVLAIDKRSFQALDPADQAVMREVIENTFTRLNKINRDDNQKALAALKKQGIEINTLDAAEEEKLRGKAERAIEDFRGKGVYTPELLEDLRGHLTAYRAKTE
ncbi:MAG: TRAP transporter substrate-binding protein DctP [Nevskiales bacterium]